MEVICKRCNYKWNYKGGRTMYACCPNCKTTVKIQMFVHKERTALQIKQHELEEMQKKFDGLIDFLDDRNPLLLEEWREQKISQAKAEADKILKEESQQRASHLPAGALHSKENGKQKN